jgi:hypothetical protein
MEDKTSLSKERISHTSISIEQDGMSILSNMNPVLSEVVRKPLLVFV